MRRYDWVWPKAPVDGPSAKRPQSRALLPLAALGSTKRTVETPRPIAKPGYPHAADAGRIGWLAPDERKRLLAACDKSGNPDLSLVVRIALASGALRRKILYLRWPMLDLSRECRFLRPRRMASSSPSAAR